MTIVSNTSPLCYLVLISHAPVLPKLYGEVATTETVLAELLHADAPPAVRAWAAAPPAWLKIHPDPVPRDNTLAELDPGEGTAILLAEQRRAEVVLLDEAAARTMASQRGLKVAETLGVLRDAAQAVLLKLPDALDLLRKTNFRASPELRKSLYSQRDQEWAGANESSPGWGRASTPFYPDEVTVQDMKQALDDPKLGIKVIDVREADEYEIAKVNGVPLLPLSQIELRFTELDPNQSYYLHCKASVRSLKALNFLRQQGFKYLKSVKGGIAAWSDEIDRNVPKYWSEAIQRKGAKQRSRKESPSRLAEL